MQTSIPQHGQSGIITENMNTDNFVMSHNSNSNVVNMQGMNPPYLTNMSSLSQGTINIIQINFDLFDNIH